VLGEKMSETILTSIVATLGIIISVTVSIITTRLQNKIELEKVKKELDQQYAKSLFDERVKCYPTLFKAFTDYGKKMQYGKQTSENLRQFRDTIDNWNNQYGIFFTRPTARLSARFRWYLHTLLEVEGNQIGEDDWEAIYTIIGYFEECLKAEIGVSRMEPAGNIEELDNVYEFIEEKSDYKNKQF
jgi:hypothetical protein